MSSEERRKILQMVADGKLSAEQAASLIQALEADATEGEIGGMAMESAAPEFEDVRRRARQFIMIPLSIGVLITIFSAWGMYSVQQNAGVNFWFFFLLFPFLLGVLLIALGATGQGSKWLYVNVDRRRTQDGPRNITLAFPLPLGLTVWFLRTFGHNIHGMRNTNVDEIIQILDATGTSGAPLIINANDNEDGEHVQIYIG